MRLDPSVDFNWGTGSPDPSIGADTFSVRWTGEVLADFAETYTFSTTSDDGVRLSIDGAVVFDNFTDHGPTLDTAAVALSGGWHPIALEYYENGGGAQAALSWSAPDLQLEIIPQSQLYSAQLPVILAQPQMAVVIPTITNEAELREYAGAADVPELTREELARVDELYARNFDVQPVSA